MTEDRRYNEQLTLRLRPAQMTDLDAMVEHDVIQPTVLARQFVVTGLRAERERRKGGQ